MQVKHYFATRLKALREEKGLNQSQLAKELGISRGSISFYENGDRTPDIEVLCKISQYFHVDCDYLLGISNLRKSKSNETDLINKMGLSDNTTNKIIDMNSKYSNFIIPINPINILCDDDGYLPSVDKFFEAIISAIEFTIYEHVKFKKTISKAPFTEYKLPYSDSPKLTAEDSKCLILTGYKAADFYLFQACDYLKDIVRTYSTDAKNAIIDKLERLDSKGSLKQLEPNFFDDILVRKEGVTNGNNTQKR